MPTINAYYLKSNNNPFVPRLLAKKGNYRKRHSNYTGVGNGGAIKLVINKTTSLVSAFSLVSEFNLF